MDTPNRTLCYAFTLVLASALPAAADEVLLLKHGGLLGGRVIEDEQSFLVQGEGQEYRIDKSRVAGKFADRRGAYEWLLAKLEASGAPVEARLRLAEWCLSNDLPESAEQQLAAVLRVSPDHPRVSQLRTRLAQYVEQAPSSIARAAAEPPDLAPTPRGVQQASYAAPSDRQLLVPPSELSEFTRRVQPLLVNNCTTSGCHLPTTEGEPSPHTFTLDRSLLHGYADARSTEANLRSVLALIDATDAEASPLIAAATGPHAGVQAFAGTRREEWLVRLQEWVQRIVDANTEPQPNEGPIRDAAVAPASFEAEVEPAQQLPLPTTVRPQRPEPNPLSPAAAESFQPRDEFDPELFHRRYGQSASELEQE